MQNRVDIKDFILKIEKEFPVNQWKINSIHLWPYLRIRLFFYLIDLVESKEDSQNRNVGQQSKLSFFQKVKKKIKKKIKPLSSSLSYYKWMSHLKRKETIFVGSDSHRVNYKGARFNRYFDVLIEKDKKLSNSVYFEYASHTENQYNKKKILKFNKALEGYLFIKPKKKINFIKDGYKDFLSFLNEDNRFIDYANRYNENSLIHWAKSSFFIKIDFFEKVLQKIQPKKVAILCYYSEDLFALTVAANNLGIETIEMQHGPQTDIHLCYGNWSKIPDEGYSILPRTFWCWDDYSKSIIEKWAIKNSLYSVKTIGNPWVNYWKNKKAQYKYKDFILYCLQPNPITLNQLFTPEIITLIKESEKTWFIRLHPRQLKKLDSIKSFLDKNKILDLVNIENATNDPLPQLLLNASLHITHSSGAALEASYFGLKTILINEIGLSSFPHLIENGLAVYQDYSSDDFFTTMNSILKKLS